MKRLIFCLIALCVYTTVDAQVGIRGGLNYSNIKVDSGGPDFGSAEQLGYHLGLQGNIDLPGIVSIRPGLLYHMKGGKEDQSGSGSTKLSYIETPLNLGLNIGSNKFKLVIEGGVYFGFLVDASSNFIPDIKNRFNKSDWGSNFGAVIEISNLGIGINYSNSLSGINQNDQLNQAFRMKNGNLSLFVYVYLF